MRTDLTSPQRSRATAGRTTSCRSRQGPPADTCQEHENKGLRWKDYWRSCSCTPADKHRQEPWESWKSPRETSSDWPPPESAEEQRTMMTMTTMTTMTTKILRDDVVSSGSFGWCSRPREWVAADLVAFGPALAPSLSRRHRPRGKESPSPGKRKNREKTSSLKQKSKKRESSSRRRFVFSFFSLFSLFLFSLL